MCGIWLIANYPYILYSGKIWHALNLAILAKTPYFLIWRVLHLAIRDFDRHCYDAATTLQCDDTTTMQPSLVVDWVTVAQAEKRPWLGCFHWHTFPSLLSSPVFTCTSSWDWACSVYWLWSASPPQRERNPRHCVLWGTYSYLEVQAQLEIEYTEVADQQAGSRGFNFPAIW